MVECVRNDIRYLDRSQLPSSASGEVLSWCYRLRHPSHRGTHTRNRFRMGFLDPILATAGQWLSAMHSTRSCTQSLVTPYVSCVLNMQSSGHVGIKWLVATPVV